MSDHADWSTTEHPALTAAREAVEDAYIELEESYHLPGLHSPEEMERRREEAREAVDSALAELVRIAQLVGRVEALREFSCGRWSDPEYACLARLARGETLFGNEMCERCRLLAEAEAAVGEAT